LRRVVEDGLRGLGGGICRGGWHRAECVPSSWFVESVGVVKDLLGLLKRLLSCLE
jgi:hypothetical protein